METPHMPHIKFTATYTVDDHARTQHLAGDVIEASEASCMHFVNRGVAEFTDAPKPATKKTSSNKADK